MKKLLGIVVLGLLFCNSAGALTLNKCYKSESGGKKIQDKFDSAKFEDFYFETNLNQGTITRVYILTNDRFEKLKKEQKEMIKESPSLKSILIPYSKVETRTWPINFVDDRFIVAEDKYQEDPDPLSKLIDIVHVKITIDTQKNQVDYFYERFAYEDGSKIRTGVSIYQCEDGYSDTSSDVAGTSGTAFFINNRGNLLTNNHVVAGCKSQKINYFSKEYDVEIIATDRTLDLALLKANVKPKSFISFSKNEPKKRQTITAAGYPLGQFLSDDLKINDGRISALKGFENNSNEIQHDIPINPGNSGGPIVNEKGQLVAIAVSGMAKDITEGLNFGIKSSAAANFLKSNKISPSAGYFNFSTGGDKLVKLLEESTVYTFCN